MLIEGLSDDTSPGTHAFVVGVSHYPFADGPAATARGEQSGISNLTGAARSASEVAAWLLTEYCNPLAPLASLRVLLSPSEGELIHPALAARMGAGAPATRDAVKTDFYQFRQACKANTDNVAFVYVAGHGVQLNKRGAIVLLEDFAVDGEDLLYGAIDMAGCHSAMDEAENARHQLWFSDACRQLPDTAEAFEALSGAYRPGEEGHGQADCSPLFLAASTRENAYAAIGGLTIFSDALLTGLRGEAGVGPTDDSPDSDYHCERWHVPVTSLVRYLPAKVRRLLAGSGSEQRVDITGRLAEMVTHWLRETPDVTIIAGLHPEDAHRGAVATLLFDAKHPCEIDPTWPMVYTGDAGLYKLMVNVDPPFTDAEKFINANPPSFQCNVKVG